MKIRMMNLGQQMYSQAAAIRAGSEQPIGGAPKFPQRRLPSACLYCSPVCNGSRGTLQAVRSTDSLAETIQFVAISD